MGAVTYLSARNALLYASTKGAGLAATGIILGTLSSDDEKDKTSLAKRYLYDFQKSSSIAPQKVGDGVFEYVDVSASDPHGAIDKIINRISESENLEDAAINSFSQAILEPFLGGEMTANLISAVSKGEKLTGALFMKKQINRKISYIKQWNMFFYNFSLGFLNKPINYMKLKIS